MLSSFSEQENEVRELFGPRLHWFHSIQPNKSNQETLIKMNTQLSELK